MSGGSTPKKEEEEKYYADADSGIPFVRVQNLNVDSHLSLDDVKYVNRETHEGLLNRSKVLQDDLLVKITGVGRMAVASVPPVGFEGNINQHIARIRTQSRATSEALAAWLNTDIAETLAKRRSTGGTRPALDYPALRSIPVILDEQMQKELSAAYAKHKQAEAKASELLAGIDEYLLSELGITLPSEPENIIANRIFTAYRKELAGWRFDPYYFGGKFHTLDEALNKAAFKSTSLCSLYLSINNGIDCRDFIEDGIPYAKVADIKAFSIELDNAHRIPEASIPDRGFVKRGDLLLTRKGTFGVAAVVDTDSRFAVSSEVFRIRTDTSKVLADFLAIVLNSSICQAQFDRQKIGAIMGSLTQASLRRIMLPLPPLQKQSEIYDSVALIQSQASVLRQQAQDELDAAKRSIEVMLLRERTI
ncbi:TPA: restriction endonuclease subunit S [Vibrio cholerae]